MAGKPQRLDHPWLAYPIGWVFIVTTLAVLGGVVHHLGFSTQGPQLLRPLQAKYEAMRKSIILEEAKRQEQAEQHRHFHRVVAPPQIPEDKRPACYICHSDFPHTKTKKTRALMNMHTQYLVCESCHIKPVADAQIEYQWRDPEIDKLRGSYFGTRYMPKSGKLAWGQAPLAKIEPFYRRGNRLESAVQVQSAPLARDFVKFRDALTPEQREGAKARFHQNIKPQGHSCKSCHKRHGALNLRSLGFSDKRIADLEQLNITGMLAKYEVFYLPDLLE